MISVFDGLVDQFFPIESKHRHHRPQSCTCPVVYEQACMPTMRGSTPARQNLDELGPEPSIVPAHAGTYFLTYTCDICTSFAIVFLACIVALLATQLQKPARFLTVVFTWLP